MKYSEKLRDPRWQRKRLEIFNRDNFTCLCCGAKDKTLNVHHKEYHGNPWDAPSESLETLCEPCHKERSDNNKWWLALPTRDALKIAGKHSEFYKGRYPPDLADENGFVACPVHGRWCMVGYVSTSKRTEEDKGSDIVFFCSGCNREHVMSVRTVRGAAYIAWEDSSPRVPETA